MKFYRIILFLATGTIFAVEDAKKLPYDSLTEAQKKEFHKECVRRNNRTNLTPAESKEDMDDAEAMQKQFLEESKEAEKAYKNKITQIKNLNFLKRGWNFLVGNKELSELKENMTDSRINELLNDQKINQYQQEDFAKAINQQGGAGLDGDLGNALEFNRMNLELDNKLLDLNLYKHWENKTRMNTRFWNFGARRAVKSYAENAAKDYNFYIVSQQKIIEKKDLKTRKDAILIFSRNYSLLKKRLLLALEHDESDSKIYELIQFIEDFHRQHQQTLLSQGINIPLFPFVSASGFFDKSQLKAIITCMDKTDDVLKEKANGDVNSVQSPQDLDIHSLQIPIVPNFPEELERIITFINNPEPFKRFKVSLPKGAILCGPPGTGKTAMAEAFADQINASFYFVDSALLAGMYLGETEHNIKNVVAKAVEKMKQEGKLHVLIFFDEIDSIGGVRGNNSSNQIHHTSVTNALLTMIDRAPSGVIIFGSSNDSKRIDPALQRSGRMPIIEIGIPDKEHRTQLWKTFLNYYTPNDTPVKPYSTDDIKRLVDLSEGCTPADIKEIMRNVSLQAGNAVLSGEQLTHIPIGFIEKEVEKFQKK